MRTMLSVAVAAGLFMPNLLAQQTKPPATSVASPPTNQIKTASGLIYEIVVPGTGALAQRGDKVRIHETLSLPDGRVIFNSREKNQTVTFVLGANHVIPGVDEGVTGMRVGERRRLLVRPSLDGRKFDPSFIPPDAIRHYDIELLEIVK
jgi:FKBP-type peptidyl-prolyl cis-trans isomerase